MSYHQRLVDQLIRHEGIRLHPYIDTTGHVTIGVGRNLTDVGISHTEAMLMLEHDIEQATRDCSQFLWFRTDMGEARQAVLIDMCFNLGLDKLREFKRTLNLIIAGAYSAAADEMLQSKWARQVGQRAVTLSLMMRTGEWPVDV
jgi:lysozyme